jgi:hypothetical protein
MKKKWGIGLLCLGLLVGLVVSSVLLSVAEEKGQPAGSPADRGNPNDVKPVKPEKGPGKQGAPPRPGFARDRRPVDERQPVNKEEIYAFLKEFDPERLEKLQHLERENPELFERVLQEAQHRLMQIRELKERDPARFEQVMQEQQMERSVRELARKYRESQTDQEKETVRTQMKETLDKIFNLKESQREAEVRKLEEEVNKLKERMQKRKANKDKIIDKRIKILTGEEEEEDLGW